MCSISIFFHWQLLVLSALSSLSDQAKSDRKVWKKLEAIKGKEAVLHCDVPTLDEADMIYVVLWYINGRKEPIYSYDNRPRTLNTNGGRHIIQSSSLEGRVLFGLEPYPALRIRPLLQLDQGNYTCRVDFRLTHSHTTHIKLVVVTPPAFPYLMIDNQLFQDEVLEHFREGTSLVVKCIVIGGQPPPTVVWLMNDKVIDPHMEFRSSERTSNQLTISELERKFQDALIVCQSSNSNITEPQRISYTLSLQMRPLFVRIVNPPIKLSEKKTYELRCISGGSRPEPNVTWTMEGRHTSVLLPSIINHEPNMSLSLARITSELSFHGMRIVCTAVNTLFPDTVLRDSFEVNVTYPPTVTLELGRGVSQTIKEGEDVYFDCRVKSNPPNYKIRWYHQASLLVHSLEKDVVIIGNSMALRDVNRYQSGSYVCIAVNEEGEGMSQPVTLQVDFSPVCSDRTKVNEITASAVGQPINVTCEVTSSPKDIKFWWIFNNSVTSERVPHSQVHLGKEGSSTVTFLARSLQDYGTLQCFAENKIGRMELPCLFHIMPADRPDPPVNCSVFNKTYDSLLVQCKQGFDGGLQQHFVITVFEAFTGKSQINLTSEQPSFTLSGLTPGNDYIIHVKSFTHMGESDVVKLEAVTYKMAENRMREEKYDSRGMHPVMTTETALSSSENKSPKDGWTLTDSSITIIVTGIGLLLMGGVLLAILLVKSIHGRRSRDIAREEAESHRGETIFIAPPPGYADENLPLQNLPLEIPPFDMTTEIPPSQTSARLQI